MMSPIGIPLQGQEFSWPLVYRLGDQIGTWSYTLLG
jgi:hypothetical protein